jgi:ATP-dependent RNA helicase DeaD
VAKFNDEITAALSTPAQSMFKGLVLDYARENDVPLADIAAALAVMTRDEHEFLLPPDQPARSERPSGPSGPKRASRPSRRPNGPGGSDRRRQGSGKPAASGARKPRAER